MRKIGIYGKLIHADNVQFLEMLVKSLREKQMLNYIFMIIYLNTKISSWKILGISYLKEMI